MTRQILSINGGSSSIKFALFNNEPSLPLVFEGRMEKIGQKEARFWVKSPTQQDTIDTALSAPDMQTSVQVLVEWIKNHTGHDAIAAIGYRVVHGGPKYSDPTVITDEMLTELEALIPFDPEHMPGNIQLIHTLRSHYPTALHIACFDSAFHRDVPAVARFLAIPRSFEKHGVRRYGFHGLSYASILEKLKETEGDAIAGRKIIIAHLGSGASLVAIQDGKSIDTSMSFTPASGIPMSTRSGDIDPGLFLFLSQTMGFDAKKIDEVLNQESGLLGLSETSANMDDLLKNETNDPRAREAVSFFCYHVKKWIGAYAAALGGLDMLVFTGGIGEQAPEIRLRICEHLEFLGISLDRSQNERNEGIISMPTGRVKICTMHSDEELMIARLTQNMAH